MYEVVEAATGVGVGEDPAAACVDVMVMLMLEALDEGDEVEDGEGLEELDVAAEGEVEVPELIVEMVDQSEPVLTRLQTGASWRTANSFNAMSPFQASDGTSRLPRRHALPAGDGGAGSGFWFSRGSQYCS